jgi:hypothetical protein
MGKQSPEPKASRPHIPDYGIPTDAEGLLPWSHVTERMQVSINYWISTADPNGQPHATPVWGVWLEDTLYFDGSPKTRRGRDLAANPKISVHLEDGSETVILEGQAHELRQAPLDLREKLAAAYSVKYAERGYAPGPETWQAGGLYQFKPHLAFAWTKFPQDTTRWHFMH